MKPEKRKEIIDKAMSEKFTPNRWDFANANGMMSPGDCRKEAEYCLRDAEALALEVALRVEEHLLKQSPRLFVKTFGV